MVENENQEKEVSEVAEVADYSALTGLAEEEFMPEPWYVSFFCGLKDVLLKCLFWVIGFLIDIFLGLFKIVAFVFKAIVGLFVGIYLLGRKLVRIWRDVDWPSRIGFIVQGAGNLKAKQWLDGFVFLFMEIAFVAFMVLIGSGSIANLIVLSDVEHPMQLPNGQTFYPQGSNQVTLMLGFVSVFVVIAYAVVFVLGFRSMYDTHQIAHASEYSRARADAAYVIEHYDDFYVDENGKRLYLADLSAGKVYRLMLTKWGYCKRSARYISYVEWRKANKVTAGKIATAWYRFRTKVYDWYKGKALWLKARSWASPLDRFLEPKKPELTVKGGISYLLQKQKRQNTVFHHKFDKYNDFHSYLRDHRIFAGVYSQGKTLYDAVYARDSVSRSNGVEPIEFGTKLNRGAVVSRVVGAFEIPLSSARRVAYTAIKVISEGMKTQGSEEAVRSYAVDTFSKLASKHQEQIRAFADKFGEKPVSHAIAMADAYGDYLKLRAFYDEGKKVFVNALVDVYNLDEKEACIVYEDYRRVIAASGDDEMESIKMLEARETRYREYAAGLKKMPFHGKPTGGFKRVKEFADEKFAVTVMTIPTLGCLIVTVLPLICSIAVAFTNWDANHTRYFFTWDISAFGKVFDMFGITGGSESYSYTFVKLLGWTIIWAIFATFTNYFAGILLALLINRKTIKLKSLYRTLFVVSIAIPQFITLLTINQLLADSGPINTFTSQYLGFTIDYLGSATNSALIPKITCIVVNMWIGVPYTMLSVSGILMNIPEDLYESARIDGAGPFKQLVSITMPYVLFVTGPSLITTFVGNINNFNVIYFLVGVDGPNKGVNGFVSSASDTDLLINWLYNLCTGADKDFNIASVIGIAIFAVCAFLSLVVYNRMGSVKNEEAFQ